jgi:hypothetical protein
MFIYEGNRAWVEQQLMSLREDRQVAKVLVRIGAKLDGTDSVLTLCCADDVLRERAGSSIPILRPPPLESEPVPPRSNFKVLLSQGARSARARQRAKEAGEPLPEPFDYDSAFAKDRERLRGERAKYDSVPRYRDRSRSRVEEAVASGTVSAERLLEEVRAVPEERARFLAFGVRMNRIRDRAEEINELGGRIASLFASLGYFDHDYEPVALDVVCKRVWALDDYLPLEPAQLAEQQWLLAELELALGNPLRLSFRRERASQIVRKPGPYANHGPASLLEAVEYWLGTWSVDEERRTDADEEVARVRLHRVAGRVVALLGRAMAWHSAAEPAGRGARELLLGVLDSALNEKVSLLERLPPKDLLTRILVNGDFDAGRISPRTRSGGRKRTRHRGGRAK